MGAGTSSVIQEDFPTALDTTHDNFVKLVASRICVVTLLPQKDFIVILLSSQKICMHIQLTKRIMRIYLVMILITMLAGLKSCLTQS